MRKVDIGVSEQLVSASLPPVAIDGETVLAGLVGGEREAAEQRPGLIEAFRLRGERAPARRSDAADVDAERRQPLVGIVGAKRKAVLGAAGEHAIGLGHAAGDEVVDHHAEIAVGAGRR